MRRLLTVVIIFLSMQISGQTVTDIAGNVYHTVKIGNQVWMVENLRTTHYNDSSAIHNETDPTKWSKLTTGAYCWYDNNEEGYLNPIGALYNWYAVSTDKLCPIGWHVPSNVEWEQLIETLGGETEASIKMKSIEGWDSDTNRISCNGTNVSGLNAYPSGGRYSSGGFGGNGVFSVWFSSTEDWGPPYDGGIVTLYIGCRKVFKDYDSHECGFPIRCIKD